MPESSLLTPTICSQLVNSPLLCSFLVFTETRTLSNLTGCCSLSRSTNHSTVGKGHPLTSQVNVMDPPVLLVTSSMAVTMVGATWKTEFKKGNSV